MVSPKSLQKFAKAKGYAYKELCTGRFELSRDYELLAVRAVFDDDENGVRVHTSPKYIPLLLMSVVFFAVFPPLAILSYFIYSFLAWLRVNGVKKELKAIEGV